MPLLSLELFHFKFQTFNPASNYYLMLFTVY